MLKKLLFLVLLSSEPALVHSYIFKDVPFFSINCFMVFFQSLVFFGLLLCLNKNIIRATFVLESILFAFLIIYHKYFDAPIPYHNIFAMAGEGLTFAKNSPLSFACFGFWLPFVAVVVKLLLLECYHPLSTKPKIKIIFGTLLAVIVTFSSLSYYKKGWSNYDFRAYVRFFGYPQGWLREAFTYQNRFSMTDIIISASHQKAEPLPQELQYIKLPNHVYMVQVESLDYEAVFKEINGKKVMPYLSEIAQKGNLYKIKEHDKVSTATVDFGILMGLGSVDELINLLIFVGSFDDVLYENVHTMPKTMREKGYYSQFYHGNDGSFFSRQDYISKLGFDSMWFKESLPIKNTPGDWGFEDKDLFDFALKSNKNHSKTLDYIITVSSHESFGIGKTHTKIISNPKGLEDFYYNSINYVDEGLKSLVKKAPSDSLFIIYSDHQSEMDKAHLETFFLVYDKQNPQKTFRTITMDDKLSILKSLFFE